MPHYLQSDSNTMNPSRIRRCMIEPEEIWSKNAEENESSVKILQGCENSQVANFRNLRKPTNFRRLRNFATLLPAPVDYFLTRLFVVLYKSTLDVILVPLYTFVTSLVLSTYISSVLFVNQSIFSPSINQ